MSENSVYKELKYQFPHKDIQQSNKAFTTTVTVLAAESKGNIFYMYGRILAVQQHCTVSHSQEYLDISM